MKTVSKQWKVVDFDTKQRFQNIIFPHAINFDPETKSFGTSQISPLYRSIERKRTPEEVQKSYLVAGAGLEPATLWL